MLRLRLVLPLLTLLGCAHQPAEPAGLIHGAPSFVRSELAREAPAIAGGQQARKAPRGGGEAPPALLVEGAREGAPCISSLPPAATASNAAAPDAAELAVRRLLADQVAAWNRGDLEGYMAGYWRSPQLTFYGGGSVTTGWTETLARYRRRYQGEGKAMGTLEFANLEVQVLGRDAALARGRWTLHFAPAPASASDGRPADKVLSGLFTVVLRHLPEGWRVVHDHSCAD